MQLSINFKYFFIHANIFLTKDQFIKSKFFKTRNTFGFLLTILYTTLGPAYSMSIKSVKSAILKLFIKKLYCRINKNSKRK